jgi:hypothetical protein
MIDVLIFLQAVDHTIDEDFNWQLAFFLTISAIALFTAIAVVGWQFMATWRARLPIQRDASFQRVAEEATAAQEATSDALGRLSSDVRELSERVSEVERLLRSVE